MFLGRITTRKKTAAAVLMLGLGLVVLRQTTRKEELSAKCIVATRDEACAPSAAQREEAVAVLRARLGDWILGFRPKEIEMRKETWIRLGLLTSFVGLGIAATLGPSLTHTMLALSTVYWPWYARLSRGLVLSLREREFILAARVSGARR